MLFSYFFLQRITKKNYTSQFLHGGWVSRRNSCQIIGPTIRWAADVERKRLNISRPSCRSRKRRIHILYIKPVYLIKRKKKTPTLLRLVFTSTNGSNSVNQCFFIYIFRIWRTLSDLIYIFCSPPLLYLFSNLNLTKRRTKFKPFTPFAHNSTPWWS